MPSISVRSCSIGSWRRGRSHCRCRCRRRLCCCATAVRITPAFHDRRRSISIVLEKARLPEPNPLRRNRRPDEGARRGRSVACVGPTRRERRVEHILPHRRRGRANAAPHSFARVVAEESAIAARAELAGEEEEERFVELECCRKLRRQLPYAIKELDEDGARFGGGEVRLPTRAAPAAPTLLPLPAIFGMPHSRVEFVPEIAPLFLD